MEMELFDPPEPDRTGGRGARAGSAGSTSGPSAPRGAEKDVPLADRMRPRTIDEVLGQDRLLGPGKVLRRAIERDEVRSVIFWGPPGTGKTTLARIIAQRTGAHFITLSAVLHGVKDLRAGIDEARAMRRRGRKTILFIDEIHRFNKAQQDGLLPSVEDGTVILIGATTENPSFEIIAALLSRARVFVLEALGESSLLGLLQGALEDKERGLGRTGLRAEEDALRRIASLASGDARAALNILELAAAIALDESAPGGPARGEGAPAIGEAEVSEAAQRRVLLYDKSGEEHYNLISALHKTLRSSDPDGALYWLGRMLEAGEDPMYLLRRLVRFATEDVGLADPRALQVAMAAQQAFHFIGLPEGKLAIAELTVYLAAAPKSDSVYRAYGRVQRAIEDRPAEPVPKHLRNAPTGLMKDLGYGKGYQHAHQFDDAVVEMEGLPDGLRGERFYRPGKRGFEAEIASRLRRREEILAERMGKSLGVPEEPPSKDCRPTDPAMPGRRARRPKPPGGAGE